MNMAWQEEPHHASMPRMSWSAADLQLALGVRTQLPRDVVFTSVTIDSRQVLPQSLFVALKGENHDGHSYVARALAQGSLAAVVSQPIPDVPTTQLIVVEDTLFALGQLAAWTRRQTGMRVAAITGSSGKSTTKEMTANICAEEFATSDAVLATEGNLNNLIGLPLTLLRTTGRERVAVLEMGMNRPGEIARLTQIAQPDVGVITNIGLAHAEGCSGTIAGVARAKGELVAGLSGDAVLAINLDDEWVRRVSEGFSGRRVTYGVDGDVRARHVRDFGFDGIAFDLEMAGRRTGVHLRLVGVHNVSNALAAAALGYALGFRLEAIACGLERTVGMSMRMEVVRLDNGITLINDAYNANPSSVEAAMTTLQRCGGRSVVVLGDMRELGVESRRAHHKIGERAAALGIGYLILMGQDMQAAAEGAREAGFPEERIVYCASHAAAAEAVRQRWRPGDTILVKGSHGMRMDEVVRLLENAGMPH